MTPERFDRLTAAYPRLRMAVVGDFCLDRYLEIDPARNETSLETGLPVHNVVRVRSQAGGAGTVVNNLAALGVGDITVIGFCGEDGEGYELQRALARLPGVRLDHFLATPARSTFTYVKPLVVEPGGPPRELNRLDQKNWTPTPAAVTNKILDSLAALRGRVDAVIALDQVSEPETGVLTKAVRAALPDAAPIVMADSRRGLGDYPPLTFKMNAAELQRMTNLSAAPNSEQARLMARKIAQKSSRAVFVTLAENGIVAASPNGIVAHAPALPTRGPIDIVGAGDAVTANLAAALSAGADLSETLDLAMAAASVVVHQLGTTGSATVAQLRERHFA